MASAGIFVCSHPPNRMAIAVKIVNANMAPTSKPHPDNPFDLIANIAN